MEERKDFEDIVSDTSFSKDEFVDISSSNPSQKGKHYAKKKHGISGFFQRVGQWWKNLKKFPKAAIITATSLVLVVSIAAGIFFSNFKLNHNKSFPENPEELGFENIIDEKIVNIALFGIDSRSDGFKGNSDSIMVISINTQTKAIKLVSIVRDTLVPIEQNGKTKYKKINSCYQTGPELAIKTINKNFGLDISEYATVNFDGMAKIIDAVGGIDAELVAGEVVPVEKSIYMLNGCIADICSRTGQNPEKFYITKPGKYHLNGVQAVAYSRIRKTENVWGTNDDYGRTDRQRHVMEQLFKQALNMKKSEYVKLAKALLPYTETSLSYTEIMGLAFDILLESPTFSQSRVPLDEYRMDYVTIKGVGECVYYDLDYAKDLLHAYFYDDITPEKYIEENGVRKNDWYGAITSGGSTSSGNNSGGGTSSGSGSDGTTSGGTSSDITPPTTSGDTGTDDDNLEPEIGDGDEGNESGDSGTESENQGSTEGEE